jgi:Tol biopolymer transport system component
VATGSYAVFSPDGSALVYSNAEPGRNHSVWRLPFDREQGVAAGPGVALTLGTSESASLAISRDGSRLAVASLDRSVNLEAMPFDADGSGVRGAAAPLTRGGHRVAFFGASPDGRSVVFQDDLGSESHLWRVDAGGAEPFQLTLDPGFDESFARWSPDGRTIAFSRRPRGAPDERELWLMAADGAGQRAVGVKPTQRSAWLDASSLVAFRALPRGYVRVDVASGRVAPVLENAYAMPIFDVTQDGRWLAGQSNEHEGVDVLAARLDGSEKPRFVVTAPTEDYHPFFSPSGRWLYYQPEHKNIWRVPGPAQGWRQAPPEQVTHLPERELYLEEPQVSRDGRTLVYARAQITGDIWLLRLAASR